MSQPQPLSQIAAFKCREDAFQRWVERRLHVMYDCMDTKAVAEWLRAELGVQSRAELDVAGPARERFEVLLSEFNRRGLV
jgi:hypothetical protein